VVAAVLLYTFSIGLLGNLEGGGGHQLSEQLMLEAYNWASTGQISGVFKNVGSSSIEIGMADVFVNGNSAGHPSGGCGAAILSPDQSCPFTVTSGGTYIMGEMYSMKIVTPSGGIFSFPVLYGGSG
jgi:hypothetical protein